MDGQRLFRLRQYALGTLMAAAFAGPAFGQGSRPAHHAGAARSTGAVAPVAATSPASTNRKPSWAAALEHHGEQRIEYAFDLASRGAVHTAQRELLKVLDAVAQTLDTDQGTQRHTEALASAQTALKEAADFLGAGTQGARPQSLSVITAAHRTPLLRQLDTRQLSPVVAMQLYYTHAAQQFVIAAGNQPVAAEALFGLGRVMAMMRDHPLTGDNTPTQLSEQKMLVFYQAAWTIDPRHYRAANEYGVMLARYNQWQQACQAFEYSVAQHAEPQNTLNLALAYERLGSKELAAQATQLSRSLTARQGSNGSKSSSGRVAPAVQWVDVETFVQSGSPAGWSSVNHQDQSNRDRGALGSAGADRQARNDASTTPSAQPAKSRSLLSKEPFNRFRSVFRKK